MQQYLPLAVLKLISAPPERKRPGLVATVPTACGIETSNHLLCHSQVYLLQQYLPLAVLKRLECLILKVAIRGVATVPTACGIETDEIERMVENPI